MKLEISPEAEQDLIEIWFYIAEDNPVNADRFLDKIAKKYHWLTEYSEAGVSRKELSSELYSFPVDRYKLYYRKNTKSLELVRVLHSSRDVNLIFD